MTLPYVRSITIPGTVNSVPINLAIPYAIVNSYVINVFCGQNNTGKSYTLEGLRKCLQLRWNHTQESKPGVMNLTLNIANLSFNYGSILDPSN